MGLINDFKNKVETKAEEEITPQTSSIPETEEKTPTPVIDRSSYNCPDCHGEGLTEDQTARCLTCNGTGKV